MTKLMKLTVIALLTGTLGLVGCGDEGGGGAAGTGGSGGGTGGSGGGTGGVGGAPGCEQTCGLDNEAPTGATEMSQIFTCSVMGIGLGLEVNFGGVPQAVLTGTDDSIDLFAQTIISAETASLIVNLADSAIITDAVGRAVGTELTEGQDVDITLAGVPCTVCFEAGVEVVVTLDPALGSYSSETENVDLYLPDATIEIDAAGIALVLSNTGDDPACFWGTDIDNPAEAPTIAFPIPAPAN